MWLDNQTKNVELAKLDVKAAQAMSKHRRLQCKARANRLLSSAKGISVAFGAGLIKGGSSDKNSSGSSSGLVMLVSKLFLTTWLSSDDPVN